MRWFKGASWKGCLVLVSLLLFVVGMALIPLSVASAHGGT